MRRTLRTAVLALTACILSGCVSSRITTSGQTQTTRYGDTLGHAMFAGENQQARMARAESR
ncbi:MAG: hypothetical protein KF912_03255 [Phycisphaeraceae bacterium]|nr:hypothetical protein [Phycisphaeraceae bacterium]MBX3366316.1 hypothetical protein [Phycisphaeraceae bacterium]QYK48772.1 MAG: hypothetical protein KF838_02725 [Phycisphaeraceae bacterium]